MQVTIQIVGWNSAGALQPALVALSKIPTDAAAIRYIDNNSRDKSVELVRRFLPQADILELAENKGFAGAHNEGFCRCTTPFVLTLDPDVEISWNGIESLLIAFADSKVAAVQGRILRKQKSQQGKALIDSAGIVHTLALNGRERGANEEDRGQFNQSASILAVTGACGLYRMEALHDVAHAGDEIFDENFFAYKEDVDLGWRLTKKGWKVLYLPVIVGTHARTLGRRGVLNWGFNPSGIYQRLRSPRTRYSLRNYVWMLVKNMTLKQDITHELFIDLRLLTFFVLSILYPPLLIVWWEIIRGLPKMWRKR